MVAGANRALPLTVRSRPLFEGNLMSIEARHALIAKAFSRVRQAGCPLETSEEFEDWLGQWARGDIDIQTLRKRYVELLQTRDAAWRERHVLVD